MMHELKIDPKWFEDVAAYRKNFEIRRYDRDFKVGDTLLLKEWNRGKYTGRECRREIEYIYEGDGTYGVSEEFCILGLKGSGIHMTMNGNGGTQIGYVQNMTL